MERVWPWLVLALMVLPAVWHVVDFPDDVDPEFPRVVRPTFSKLPPPAYRLAEPGDTIDRVAIYLSATAIVLSLAGAILDRRKANLWPTALVLSFAAFWHASNPGPTFDGWHGLGWRTVFDTSAPSAVRGGIAAAGGVLLALLVVNLLRNRNLLVAPNAKRDGIRPLLVVATVLVALRQFDIPGVEPVGYWPRWCFVWGVAAFNLALFAILSRHELASRRQTWSYRFAGAGAWVLVVCGGIWLTWFHRPLERLREVEPGKIYLSAMPTYAGLKVAYGRHPFKTIINLFAEDTPQRSPILGDELRFAKEHGIRYVNAPAEQSKADAFLDETLKIAQDPDAWPILVHCHGCMDRSPAWMGIYRFLVQDRPLDDIFREIEGHRGYRPKASVTLLYNRVLPARAPEKYLNDPTGRLLLECTKGTTDPFFELVRKEKQGIRRK